MVFLRAVERLGHGHKDTHSMAQQTKFSETSLVEITHSKVLISIIFFFFFFF